MNKLPGVGATPRTTTSSIFRRCRRVIHPLALVLVLAHAALGFSKTSQPVAAPCSVAEPSAHDASDLQGFIHYQAVMRQLFAEKQFAKLDCFADAARTSKAHFAGGAWKLSAFYRAIEAPQGHATEQDWTSHLKTLNRWVSAKPESITARVALADAYTKYAWNARGADYSNTVTQSGWKLFDQRIEKAKTILEEASRLKTKCPQWYLIMQTVALAQSWDLARATALLDQAVGFEPDYYYYYRSHANYLKPQWYGEAGDAEQFAAEAADRVGGEKGDILYFQIAIELICHCAIESHLKLLSWPRIQKGAAELEKQNGVSLINLNALAFIATRLDKAFPARDLFARIGNDRDEDVWRTQEYFDSSMKWAIERAEFEETPEQKIFQQASEKFADAIRQCVQESGEMTKFDLVFNLTKFGIVESALSFPRTKAGLCLAKLKGEKLSPFPPTDPYAFLIPVDPAQIINAPTK